MFCLIVGMAAEADCAAFEVKLSPGSVDGAARSLSRFMDQLDTERVGQPRAIGVTTATGNGYRRADGILVIPIGTPGP